MNLFLILREGKTGLFHSLFQNLNHGQQSINAYFQYPDDLMNIPFGIKRERNQEVILYGTDQIVFVTEIAL